VWSRIRRPAPCVSCSTGPRGRGDSSAERRQRSQPDRSMRLVEASMCEAWRSPGGLLRARQGVQSHPRDFARRTIHGGVSPFLGLH